ncbi:ABC transporter permease, partial [Rhizobiaceae sp. 2RAB30]
MLPFAGMLAIVTVGQTLIIQQRGLDMSAVGAISLAGMLVSIWSGQFGQLWLAVLATLFAGGLIGAVNGLLVTRVNVTPIVATLATNALLIGAVRQISGGAPLSAPREMRAFSIQTFLGLPYSLWLARAVVIVVANKTTQTAFGPRGV